MRLHLLLLQAPTCCLCMAPPPSPQSCAMLGAFSYFVDSMGGGEAHAMPAAAARCLGRGSSAGSDGGSSSSSIELQRQQRRQRRQAVKQILSAFEPCRFAVELGGGAPAGGCRVRPLP